MAEGGERVVSARPARPCPRPGRVFTLKPNGGTWAVPGLLAELLAGLQGSCQGGRAALPACCCGCSAPAELRGSRGGQGWSPEAPGAGAGAWGLLLLVSSSCGAGVGLAPRKGWVPPC